jgi:hypothetical protein
MISLLGPILFLAIVANAIAIIGYGYWMVMGVYTNSERGPATFNLWERRKQLLVWFLLFGIELILMVLTVALPRLLHLQ